MSFRLKTVLGIALIEAILLLILVGSSLSELRHMGDEQLQQRAATTAKLFATTSADAVLSSDLATLEAFVAEILTNPGIAYARVIGDDVVLAADGDQSALLRQFVTDNSYENVIDGVFDTYAPITIGGETYGRVEIGLDVEHLHHELQRATHTFSAIAVSELLLSGLFSVVLGTLLTRQLHSLIKGTRAVSEGRFGYQLEVKGRDEIAQAVSAFNEMSSDLAQLMDENRQQRHHLQASTDLLSGLVDNLQSAVLLEDTSGRILHVNAVFTDLFQLQFQPGDLMGKPQSEIDHALRRHYRNTENAVQRLNDIVDHGELILNERFELNDERVIETDFIPLIADGHYYAKLWVHRDITDRVAAERLTELRKQQLHTVFELSPDGFVYFDHTDRLQSVNQAFLDMTGINEERLLGLSRRHFFAHLYSACGVTDVDDSPGYRLIRTSRPAARALTAQERVLRGATDAEKAIVLYIRDVTHEKALDDIKAGFLTAAAHEFRVPLSEIHTSALALQNNDTVTPATRPLVDNIERHSTKLLETLREVLVLTRLETRAEKEFQIHYQPLLPILQDAVSDFQSTQQRTLMTDIPARLPAIPVDAAKFSDLLTQILSNAFTYSAIESAVLLTAETGDSGIDISVVRNGPRKLDSAISASSGQAASLVAVR